MIDQFYKLAQDIAARKDLNGNDKIIFAIIKDYRGNPAKQVLMKKSGTSSQTVCDCIKRIEAAGVMEVFRPGNGKRNEYKTSPEIRPVKKLDRSNNQTGSGPEIRPEAVQKLDHNQTKTITQTKSSARFKKPMLEEVQNFINQNSYTVDADMWFNYYQANGWKIGRNSMKDWRACIRQWNARNKSGTNGATKNENRNQQSNSINDLTSEVGETIAVA